MTVTLQQCRVTANSHNISLGDVGDCANSVGFRWSSSLLHYLCPRSVLYGGGGGYVGYIWKALEKGYLEHHASACGTDDMFEIFVRFGQGLGPVFLAASFCQQAATMSAYKFTLRDVASPDAPQKPFVHKRARSGSAEWVQVTRHPAKQAKKPRTIGSQQQRFMRVSGQVCDCLLLDTKRPILCH